MNERKLKEEKLIEEHFKTIATSLLLTLSLPSLSLHLSPIKIQVTSPFHLTRV